MNCTASVPTDATITWASLLQITAHNVHTYQKY